MKSGNRLRTRLILVYLAATLLPVALTVWTSFTMLELSLNIAPIRELDQTSKALESVGREYYQHARDALARDAATGRIQPSIYKSDQPSGWPQEVRQFYESADASRFETTGADGRMLAYMERHGSEIRVYSQDLGIGMRRVAADFTAARQTLDRSGTFRRGYLPALLAVASVIWFAGLAFLIYWANRLSSPVQRLARGLSAVAAGDLTLRIPVDRDDEIGAATAAFNDMADQLQESRDKLVHMTRLSSWQALARKTAHEVKNSLTPIRLTMEEMIARGSADEFMRQAGQIVVDEVMSLERRVSAFSELASEPPVTPSLIDVNGMVEERVAFLRSAHPEVIYDSRLDPERPAATADPDLLKGVLTNLLKNAAEAARAGGVVMIKTLAVKEKIAIEVHDSGPGLSLQSRATIFEPTISFKKNGMGLGLSIARKSALLCGGDVALISSDLGGAAFRVLLPRLALLLIAIAVSGVAQTNVTLFDYDQTASLDYKDSKVTTRDAVTVYDASFASPKGGRVVCYVVAPDRKARNAGIVWQHGGSQDRRWFLPDAIELAKQGAVSILMDAPSNRPRELRGKPATDELEQNRDEMLQVAVDARRAFDVLAARPDVDKDRIGYTGLSFGAMMGGSLAGVDKRFKAFVLIAGLEGFVRHYKSSGHPAIASMRAKMPKPDFDRLLTLMAPIDAINFIGQSSAPLLFQAARFDPGVSEADTYDFYKAAGSPKDLQWYNTGHQINDPQAFADRAAWLKKYLRIR